MKRYIYTCSKVLINLQFKQARTPRWNSRGTSAHVPSIGISTGCTSGTLCLIRRR